MNSALSRAALRLHDSITGRHILARLEQLNHTQWLSRDELLALQRNKLFSLLEYANQYVPYYQRVFKEGGFQPNDLSQDLDNLNKIPILTKALIRKNWDDLLTTEPQRRRRMSKLTTSGSTGMPLMFMQDSDFRDAVTADIQRHMGWAGWKLGDQQALIWGAKLKSTAGHRIRAWLIDWIWNRFQLNVFLMNDATMTAFAERVSRQKPRILFGYATSLHYFAQFIQRNSYRGMTFDGIFSSAELLLPSVREYIEETFQCKVFNRYGTLDLGGLACECQAHTGLHVSVENNFVEILQNGRSAQPGETGDIVVTNLNNRGMPFIRYAIGDNGAWQPGEDCPCGRAAPMLNTVEGRITEMFQTRDGHYVRAAFSGGFSCLVHPAIKQFQVIQKSLDKIVVQLATDCEVPQSVLAEITQSIHANFGKNVVVDFVFLETIPPLPSGKHQYAISELSKS